MKIFNPIDTLIDGLRPKVIETANGFLLNTNYYEKQTVTPIPFENLQVYGSPYSMSIAKHLYCTAYSWQTADNSFGIIKDSYAPNRYYIPIKSGYVSGTRREYLLVVDEKENYEISKVSWSDWGDAEFVEYAGQTDLYFYWIARSNTTAYLKRYNKNTFAIDSPYSSPGSNRSYPIGKVLYENESYIYWCEFISNNLYMHQYNKTTNAVVTSTIYRGNMTTKADLYYTPRFDDVIDLGDGVYGVYVYNAGMIDQPIDLYTVDTTKQFTTTYSSACDIKKCNIIWNDEKTEISYSTAMSGNHLVYRIFKNKVSSKEYLNVAVYDQNYENAAYVQYQGIYTFKTIDNTNFEYCGFTPVDETKQFSGLLLDDTRSYGIVPKNQSFQIIKFDSNINHFVPTGIEVTSVYSVGLDSLRRIWYTNIDSSVNIINLADAQTIDVTFEKSTYEYDGTPIDTFITFSALNYLNEPFSGSFKLVMTGSAVFTENNDKELIFTYDGVSQNIGIRITGPNPVTIYPTFLNS